MSAKEIVLKIRDRIAPYVRDPYEGNSAALELRRKGKIEKWEPFKGDGEEAISKVEAELGIAFPEVYRQFLLVMGKSSGPLFTGSDLGSSETLKLLKEEVLEWFLDDDESELFNPIPQNAVIILTHQGYTCVFFIPGESNFDPPIYQYIETEDEYRKVADTFSLFLNSELDLMDKVRGGKGA